VKMANTGDQHGSAEIPAKGSGQTSWDSPRPCQQYHRYRKPLHRCTVCKIHWHDRKLI
jgi:hypothetical protein